MRKTRITKYKDSTTMTTSVQNNNRRFAKADDSPPVLVRSEVLSSAIKYRRRGFSVIPIMPGTKKAAGKWKAYQTKLADESQIRKWFGNRNEYGLAIVLGEVSGGLVCRDFDQLESYNEWADAHPELALSLPTVKTPRGRHIYCRAEIGLIRQKSKSGGGIITFEDGELRGDGAYCVAPPSVHPNGERYEWLIPPNGEIPFVDLVSAGLLTACNIVGAVCRETIDAQCAERAESPESTQSPQCLVCTTGTAPTVLQAIEKAILRTQPDGFRQRHQLLFDLARRLKAIPSVADLPIRELKSIVRWWYDAAKRFIRSPFEETWFDFAEGWKKVKSPAGQGPVDMAYTKAIENELPSAADEYEQRELRLLVGLCRELQRLAGPGQSFYLACRTAGDLLNVDHTTISRWLRGLQTDGIIELTGKGSRKDRKANRFQYIANRKSR